MRRLLRVDPRAGSEQRFYRHAASPARAHFISTVSPFSDAAFGSARGRSSSLDHRAVAIDAGEMQRREAGIVRDVRPRRAGANQQFGNRQIVDVRRPVQRRGAVTLRRVHVDTLPQQRADTGRRPCRRTASIEAASSAARQTGLRAAAPHADDAA